MSHFFRSSSLIILMALALMSCGSHVDSYNNTTASQVKTDAPNQPGQSDYQEFSTKFNLQVLPLALPLKSDDIKPMELDKKFIKTVLNVNFTPAFGTPD